MQIKVDDLTGREIAELLREHLAHMHSLGPPESTHALPLEELRAPGVTFWSVWENGELLGCGALKELAPAHGEIKSMRTVTQHLRKGVGRAMLDHILREARRRGYQRLSLETGSGAAFAPARQLYARAGFVACAPFAHYGEDPNSVFMTIELQRLSGTIGKLVPGAVAPNFGVGRSPFGVRRSAAAMDDQLPRSPDAFERAETTDLDDKTSDKPRGLPLHTRILIGLGVGIAAGVAANMAWGGDDPRIAWTIGYITEPVGTLFLRLLLMIVVPLVLSSLIVGVAGLGDVRKIGRVGVRSLAYCLVISAISVVIGLTLTNVIQPGRHVDATTRANLEQRYATDASKRVEEARKSGAISDSPTLQVVKSIVPSNPITAFASDPPNMLHLMFFALFIGIATTLVPSPVSQPLLRGCQALYEITAKIIDIAMKFAPYAVACLLFNNTARFGLDLLSALAWFVLTVLAGLSLHMFGVYSLSVALLSRLSPLDFFRRIKTVMLTAFSTSSSNATLPTALRVSEENLGVPREINSFVLTVGATANQNGTALYEGVTVLFLAQLAGVDLSLGQQLAVVYLAILGGVGTAGVPSGSIPFIIAVLVTVGVNPALIAIILGVDRFLDMCRTVINVTGDITAATYVARAEGFALLGRDERTNG